MLTILYRGKLSNMERHKSNGHLNWLVVYAVFIIRKIA